MTPPPATAVRTAVPGSPTVPAEVATPRARVRPSIRRQPKRPLEPAKPAAVLVPPIVLYLAVIATATAVHATLTPGPSLWTLLRAGTLGFLLLPLLYLVRAVAEGYGGSRVAGAMVPAVGVTLQVGIDALLPGWFLHPVTHAVLFGVANLAQPIGRAWRDWWVRYRPLSVTLVASSEWGADDAIARLEEIPGLQITNLVIPGCDPERATRLLGRPVLASPRGDVKLEKRAIVSCPLRDPAVGSTIAQLVALGTDISSESSVMRSAEGRVCTERADPLNLLLGRPRHWVSYTASRFLDLVLAIVMIVLLSPLFLVASLAIAIETGRPIFYRQRRVGYRGKTFDVIKFRSMYQDAESRSGPVWAQENDPRVTRVGRFLRKYRIDEIPQLWNVLRGEMALVGPRPERPHFFDRLREDVPIFELRTCVRPGITGWAQVRAPYAAAIEDSRVKLEYDLYYVMHRSPIFDLAILLETAGVAIRGRGSR